MALQAEHEQLVASRAAQEAHERTVAYAAHELRNPLHTIAASASLLRDSTGPDHPFRHDIENVFDASQVSTANGRSSGDSLTWL